MELKLIMTGEIFEKNIDFLKLMTTSTKKNNIIIFSEKGKWTSFLMNMKLKKKGLKPETIIFKNRILSQKDKKQMLFWMSQEILKRYVDKYPNDMFMFVYDKADGMVFIKKDNFCLVCEESLPLIYSEVIGKDSISGSNNISSR
jgi:hypothetical protein